MSYELQNVPILQSQQTIMLNGYVVSVTVTSNTADGMTPLIRLLRAHMKWQ